MLKYLKGYRLAACAAPVLKLCEALLELYIPFFVSGVIDNGLSKGDPGAVYRNCAMIAVFGFAGMAVSVFSQLLSARTAVGYSAALRRDALRHILALSNESKTEYGRAALITRLTADVDRIQSGINMGLRLLLRSPFIVFGSVVMAASIDGEMFTIFLLTVLILSLIVFALILAGTALQKKTGRGLESLTRLTDDNLRGVRVIRAFGREETQKDSFSTRAGIHEKASVFAGTVSSFMNPMTFAVVNIAVIIIISRGSGMVNVGRLSRGQVVALYNYMAQILTELVKLANLTFTLSRAAASGKRVASLLKSGEERTDGAAPSSFEGPVVELRDVSYRYPGSSEDAISGISFSLKEGESLGVIGGTGSGKSTLARLCAAVDPPSSGELLYYGAPVSELSLSGVREIISFVPQRAYLFSGTVKENLKNGAPDASDEDVREALRHAEALSFIESRDNGTDSEVIRGGGNFSGGQKQRLSIARALIRKPRLLILDDSFSALDYKTDLALRKNVSSLAFPHATVIISQRPSAVIGCDRILVLENGKPAGYGTHSELLAGCPLYREIYDSQYGGDR
ncbi:MAG: ABC transporter ATP-binding protein [Clostridia bacterium]|nr:ABC transporter ATP-binding protein [Clostridia bacterium]MBP5270022.1 ABC transporter ATP-binding protein [Clostridia bacterium]